MEKKKEIMRLVLGIFKMLIYDHNLNQFPKKLFLGTFQDVYKYTKLKNQFLERKKEIMRLVLGIFKKLIYDHNLNQFQKK